MVEIEINLNGNWGELVFAVEKLGAGIFPQTVEAVEAAAVHVQQAWRNEAARQFAFPSGEYSRNILTEFQVGGNLLHARIFSDLPRAEYLEDGYPAFDMKKALYTSHQVRISKDGKRYLIIPFRHGTPSRQGESGSGGNRATIRSMPSHVYDPAKRLVMSQIKSKWAERSQQNPEGSKVAHRRNYEWGERLTKEALENVGASKAEIKKYSGMVRFPQEEQRTSGTKYMTFRVMTEDSKGWIHPAQPPLKIKEKAENKSISAVRMIIEAGFQRDLETIQKLIK